MSSVLDLIDIVTRGGATAVLLIIIWAFYTDRIVTRATFRRVLEERDQFRKDWSDAVRLIGRATSVADRALKAADENPPDKHSTQRQSRTTSRLDDGHGNG